eukprot:6942818-Karenia_brevis.AAC.1
MVLALPTARAEMAALKLITLEPMSLHTCSSQTREWPAKPSPRNGRAEAENMWRQASQIISP